MKNILYTLILFFISFNKSTVFAQPNTTNNADILNQLTNNDFGGGLSGILNQLFYAGLILAVVLAIFMIIRGGLEYMTIDIASTKEAAKNRIKAAIGGLILCFSTILILNTINPGLTRLQLNFPQLRQLQVVNFKGQELQSIQVNANGTVTGVGVDGKTYVINPNITPGEEGSAQFLNVNNPDKLSASVDGVLTIDGVAYPFRSGGGDRGYLPAGTYTVTMNTNESPDGTRTTEGFVKDGVGFAFNLSDAYDSRVGGTRSDLRIHPDGRSPGTAGCIGLQGNATELLQFKSSLTNLIKQNGGSYTIKVGQ